MTITTTRLGTVIDALVTKLKASATFAAPVVVYDGPVTVGNTMATQAVFVGFAGDWENLREGGGAEGVQVNQEYRYLGNTGKSEELDVRCCVIANTGDPNTQAARNQCLTLVQGVETVIRTDPTLGIDGSTIADLNVGSFFWDNSQPEGMLLARLEFVVHVQTTLLTF